MEEKIYICECGKTFTTPNKFNGHKSNCKQHIINKHGSLEAYNNRYRILGEKIKKAAQEKQKERSEQELAIWITEQHTCEKCGKVMTEKFGSGRFCSRSCANRRPKSIEERTKIGNGVVKSEKFIQNNMNRRNDNEQNYLINPNHCIVCNDILSYELRYKQTCSDDCYRQLRADIRFKTIEQIGLNHGNKAIYKYGFYQGVECDSGWELAFLLFHLHQKHNIVRNTAYFKYTFEGAEHRYYPDFIVDNTYYEIKGYKDDRFFEKVKQFPSDKKLVVIDSSTINEYIDYATKYFGEDFYSLYDADKPNWMTTS